MFMFIGMFVFLFFGSELFKCEWFSEFIGCICFIVIIVVIVVLFVVFSFFL